MLAMNPNHLTLTRELRFGLHAQDDALSSGQVNGFAGHPPLLGLAPFLTLSATVSGTPDPSTGMLLNIKQIDEVLRACAVPRLRTFYYASSSPTVLFPGLILTQLMPELTPLLRPSNLRRLTLALSPYLSLTVEAKEPTMILLNQRFEFSAAHRLHNPAFSAADNQATFGKCNNPHGHGHNYELEVTVAGVPDPHTGLVIPIERLQQIVNTHIISQLDHKHLNLDCPEFAQLNPTVENIARVIYDKLAGTLAPATLRRVRVWETPKTSCEYPGES